MKKTILRLVCLVLALSVVFAFAGCSPSKSVQKKVLNFLHDKYGDDYEFEYIDYTQNKETNGRYDVTARCVNDGITFKIYVYSSVLITDSYSVERANATMKKQICDFYLIHDYSEAVEDITWLNIYEDNATNYSFRTIPLSDEYTLNTTESIYRIKMKDGMNPNQFIGYICNFVSDFIASGIELKSISFALDYKNCTFVINTGTDVMKEYSYGEVIEKMVPLIETRVAEKKGLFDIEKTCTIDMEAAMHGLSTAVTNSIN